VFVVVSDEERVDRPSFEGPQQLGGRGRRPAIDQHAAHQVGACPVEGPAGERPGEAEEDHLGSMLVLLGPDHAAIRPRRRRSSAYIAAASRTMAAAASGRRRRGSQAGSGCTSMTAVDALVLATSSPTVSARTTPPW